MLGCRKKIILYILYLTTLPVDDRKSQPWGPGLAVCEGESMICSSCASVFPRTLPVPNFN